MATLDRNIQQSDTLDRVTIRTLLQASLRLMLCYMEKAIFALCPIIPKNKNKTIPFFALKFLTPSVGEGTRDKALRPSAWKAKTRKTFSIQPMS